MKVYEIKNGDVFEPTRYLGAGIKKLQTPGGDWCWSMNAKEYCKNACDKVNEMLQKDGEGKGLPSKRDRPYPEKYTLETDLTEELSSRYQQLIGILRWAVELGRVDIAYEVSKLSSFKCSPRRGHLDAVCQIFAYLRGHLQTYGLIFIPIGPDVDER